jgi:hypothetical protein
VPLFRVIGALVLLVVDLTTVVVLFVVRAGAQLTRADPLLTAALTATATRTRTRTRTRTKPE